MDSSFQQFLVPIKNDTLTERLAVKQLYQVHTDKNLQ